MVFLFFLKSQWFILFHSSFTYIIFRFLLKSYKLQNYSLCESPINPMIQPPLNISGYTCLLPIKLGRCIKQTKIKSLTQKKICWHSRMLLTSSKIKILEFSIFLSKIVEMLKYVSNFFKTLNKTSKIDFISLNKLLHGLHRSLDA